MIQPREGSRDAKELSSSNLRKASVLQEYLC